MMKKYRIKTIGLLAIVLLFMGQSSCQKLDYDNGFITFGDVYFDNHNVVNLANIEVRYQGSPIQWETGSGKIRVPVGEGKFEFYDIRTGKVLAEKTVNVIADKPETFLVFQPSEDAPIAFLDPTSQTNETAPPDGYMKIKIGNYAKILLPYDEVDVIVVGVNANFEFVNLDTLESVSQNLENEPYHLVPTGGTDFLAWTFSFREHGSQSLVKNQRGTDYSNEGNFLYPDQITPYPAKRIYTIYFTPFEWDFEYDGFIFKESKFYDINPNILFSN